MSKTVSFRLILVYLLVFIPDNLWAADLPEPFAAFVKEAAYEIPEPRRVSGDLFPIVSDSKGAESFEVGKSVPLNFERFWDQLGQYSSRFHLHTSNAAGGISSELQGDVTRVYPGRLEGFDRPQRFRERLELSRESQEESFKWLTIRPLGMATGVVEDSLWVYSPILKRSRRLNGINREDRLLRSAFSLDDLGLFSRKPDVLLLVEKRSAQLLVPMIADRVIEGVEGKDGCHTVATAQLRAGAPSLFGQPASSEAVVVSWLMNETLYLRDVDILVLEEINPYRELSQEILVIDKEFQMPLYRMSYDVLGRLRFSSYQVFGAASLALEADKKTHVPASVYSLLYDHEQAKISVLMTLEQKWCTLSSPQLAEFQPQNLGPHKLGEVGQELPAS